MKHPLSFSPIATAENFKSALRYVTEQSELLARHVLSQSRIPVVDTLTIFAQSGAEYDFISTIIHRYGNESPFTHGETLYISSNLLIAGKNLIKFLGVRRPDDSRPEVGYADYPVSNDDYDAILAADYPGVEQVLTGRNQYLMELKDEKFDVRGYIVRASEHDDGVARGDVTQL